MNCEIVIKEDNLDFGTALKAMKQGECISRKGWNGSNMFVYYVPANNYKAQTEVAKKAFGENVPYRPYMALKTAQDDIATWHPSGSDALAEDWQIVSLIKTV